MKQILAIVMLCLFTTHSYPQEASPAKTSEYYTGKSIRQKRTARTLLIIGGSTAVIGAVVSAATLRDGDLTNASVLGAYAVVAGVLTSVVSVPFFISALGNKHKAAALSLNLQTHPPPVYHPLKMIRQPAITFTMNF